MDHLDEPILVTVSKPMHTEFGIHRRLESCGQLIFKSHRDFIIVLFPVLTGEGFEEVRGSKRGRGKPPGRRPGQSNAMAFIRKQLSAESGGATADDYDMSAESINRLLDVKADSGGVQHQVN